MKDSLLEVETANRSGMKCYCESCWTNVRKKGVLIMSAIYGVVQWLPKKEEVSIEDMEKTLHEYKIDSFANKRFGQAQFGCGLQMFTQEAEREVLPYVDEKEKVMITADVVLDNRAELMRQLHLERPNLPDGTLVYLAYQKWGEEFVKLLRGVFTIAIYDKKDKTCYLYTDHTGSRCVNYYKNGDSFYFSTTYAPILAVNPDIKVSDKWIAASQLVIGPDMELFHELTPYQGIFQLEAGTYLKMTEHMFEKKTYWNPIQRNKVMEFQDSKCKEILQHTFQSCVKDVLRSRSQIGATVSSGLDSTSVAAHAAMFLGKEGKRLYTYTSIPEFMDVEAEDYMIVDESFGPKALQKKYPNMQCHFLPCKGMNAFTNMKTFVQKLEFPLKSAPNMMWLGEIYKMAADHHCKIVLKGQYGNATISYGKIMGNMRENLRGGHLLRAYKEAKAFGKKNRVSIKQICKKYIKERLQAGRGTDVSSHTFLRYDWLQRYHMQTAMDEECKLAGGSMIDSREQMQHFQFDRLNLAQLGLYDTHCSLIYGVLLRDPTKDKRLIELCMSLPMEVYVHNGVERRIVREYLKDALPTEILQETMRRGVQSIDFIKRIENTWKEEHEVIMGWLQNDLLKRYIQEEKLQVLQEKYGKLLTLQEEDKVRVTMGILQIVSLSMFLEENRKERV